MAQRAVFLDRDGTLIEDVGYAARPEQIRILAGVARALVRLADAGYKLIVVTNQSGIARGLLTEEELDRFHQALDEQLDLLGARLDAYYICPHLPDHAEARRPDLAVECECRKPKPGLILRAAQDFDIDLASSWLIGDTWRDVAAGQAAGIRTIKLPADPAHDGPRPDGVAPPTAEAADIEQAGEIVLTHAEPAPTSSTPEPAPEAFATAHAPQAPRTDATQELPPEERLAEPESSDERPEDAIPAERRETVIPPEPQAAAIPPEPPEAVVPSKRGESSNLAVGLAADERSPVIPPEPQAAAIPPEPPEAVIPSERSESTPAPSAGSGQALTGVEANLAEGAGDRATARPSPQPLTCARCGVPVSAADVESGRAAYRDDLLLCPECLPQHAREGAGRLPDSNVDLLRAVLIELRRLGRLRHGGGLSMLRLLAYLVQAAALFCGLGLGLIIQEKPIMVEVGILLQILVIALLVLERNS